jgi:hypothetical protein
MFFVSKLLCVCVLQPFSESKFWNSKNLAQESTINIFSHEEQYDWLLPAQAWAIAACCV